MIDSTCPVAANFHLPYLAFHEDAEKRGKRGQKQGFCGTCERYVWPNQQRACPRFVSAPDPIYRADEMSETGPGSERCECCGRFFSLEHSQGWGRLFIPDSDLSHEEERYRCEACTLKHGPPRTSQSFVRL
jgi:hypothetical protein